MKLPLMSILLFLQGVFLLTNASINIVNLNRKITKAGSQTWMIQEAPNGFIYFANKKGLMQFDGNQWRLFSTPMLGDVRSILVSDKNSCVYVGGTNEYGYYSIDSSYNEIFHTLSDSNSVNFGSIWNIVEKEHLIYFVASEDVFVYNKDDHKTEKIHVPQMINSSLYFDGNIYLGTKDGVFILRGTTIFNPINTLSLKGMKICSMIAYEEHSILIGTSVNGLFKLDANGLSKVNTTSDNLLRDYEIFCMTMDNDILVIGTVKGGILILDSKGNFIKSYNEKNGIQNNTVLSAKVDKFHNLWVGLDNGLDYIVLNSPFSNFIESNQLVGTGYDAICFEERLYLATNRGLYYCNLPLASSMKIFPIDEISGQIWSLQILHNQLFVATDKGAFVLNNRGINKLSGTSGVWNFALIREDSSLVLGKGYNNIYVYKNIKQKWTTRNTIPVDLQDHGDLWEDSSFTFTNRSNSSMKERWIFDDQYSKIVHVEKYLKKEPEKLYPVSSTSLSYFGINLVDGFERYCIIDSNLFIICHEDGFSLYDKDKLINWNDSITAFIFKVDLVKSNTKQCLFSSAFANNNYNAPILQFQQNNLIFEFGSSNQIMQNKKYQYQLLGYSPFWSIPSEVTTKEFNNLHQGSYTFRVRCISDLNSKVSSSSEFSFTILPPWYRTNLAYSVYTLLLIILIYVLFYFDKKRIKQIEYKKKLLNDNRMRELEIELDLKHKGQEIANLTINFLRKNELLTKIKDDIHSIILRLSSSQNKEIFLQLRELSNHITSHITSDAFLHKFEENFDLANNNFIKRLTDAYPTLSVSECKLCAFLIMGLSSKEISALLDMSVRGIESNRYRLRKKFNLERTTSLTGFLKQFKDLS